MCVTDRLAQVLVAEVYRPGVTAVRVDLDRVDFLDSSAIHALVGAYRAAQRAGSSFTVVRARGHARKVLDLAGVLPILTRTVERNRPNPR